MSRTTRRAGRLWRRARRRWRTVLSVSLPLFLTWVFLLAPVASVQGDQNGVFKKRLYVGFGAGVSSLDPDSMCPCLSVEDGNDRSFSLFLGYDIARRFSVEAHYTDLGSAGIAFLDDPVGELDYVVAGVSAVGYVFGKRRGSEQYNLHSLDSKEGLSGYVRLGVGVMDNDSSLSFDRDHDVHFLTGVGLEYGWANGLALRGEVTAHDSDAMHAEVRLLKRFGENGKRNLATRALPPIEPLAPVDTAVAKREMELPLLYFGFGKFNLTAESTASLDGLATDLLADTTRRINIEGHADDIDTDDFNIELSINRAAAVKRYLMDQGIEGTRMIISGFGESRPVASNATAEGRAKNRRVEIYAR